MGTWQDENLQKRVRRDRGHFEGVFRTSAGEVGAGRDDEVSGALWKATGHRLAREGVPFDIEARAKGAKWRLTEEGDWETV